MRIINYDAVQAAEIAAAINAAAAKLTKEQVARLEETAGICLPVFAADYGKPVDGAFVYQSESEEDVDCFLLDGGNEYVLVVSSAFVDAGDVERKLMLMESFMDAVYAGPETEVDVHALNEEAGDDE